MDRDRAGVNAVVDTNVVVYYLLHIEPFADQVNRFWLEARGLFAPAHWEAEFASAVSMAMRSGALPADEAHKRLDLASRLGIRSVAVRELWQGALASAVRFDVSVYDALFVELATQRNLPLATFDRRLLEMFPEVAKRPMSILDG